MLHRRLTPPWMPILLGKLKIFLVPQSAVGFQRPSRIGDANADDTASLQYAMTLVKEMLSVYGIVQVLKKMLGIDNRGAAVFQWQLLAHVKREVDIRYQINIDPTRF